MQVPKVQVMVWCVALAWKVLCENGHGKLLGRMQMLLLHFRLWDSLGSMEMSDCHWVLFAEQRGNPQLVSVFAQT